MSQITREEFNELKNKVSGLSTQLSNPKPEKPKKPRAPSEYNKYMASKYAEIQKQNPSLAPSDVFKMVAASWKDVKENKENKVKTK